MKLDPRHLAQLSMIVEAGSFGRAAERLGMSQPALSRNIKTLEVRLGSAVFDRSGRTAIPTELGRRLARSGLSIRQAEVQAQSYADRAYEGAAGVLRIGAPPIIAGRFLTTILAKIYRKVDQCAIELRVGLVHELAALLERGRIDMVIGPKSLGEDSAGLSFEHLVDDKVGILCQRGHRLLRSKNPTAANLEREVWIAHSRGSLLRQQTETALISLGVRNYRIGCETDSIQTVLELVANTDMISTMPRASTRPYLGANLAFLNFDQPQFKRPIGVIQRDDHQTSQLESRFIEMLREQFGLV